MVKKLDEATRLLIDSLPENLQKLAYGAIEVGYMSRMDFTAATDADEVPSDEHDEVLNYVNKISENEFIVDASVAIHDINKELGLRITYKNEKYTTIAGYVTYYNEVLPCIDDEIIINNLKFNILEVDNNRIIKVKLTILDK